MPSVSAELFSQGRTVAPVLGITIDAITLDQAVQRIAAWASHAESRYVCICNAHAIATAVNEPNFGLVLNGADMATPDGAPVAWMLRRQGTVKQRRVSGPDLMPAYFRYAASVDEAVFLYGSSTRTLQRLQARLLSRWPKLRIAGAISPPFRALTQSEDDDIVEQMNASGARTVWVSLGCPKQERWMAAHRGHVRAVMIGVGAAFDFEAGTVHRAPPWMQMVGLEWLHRLGSEPRRLWRRYLWTNTTFVAGAVRQLLRNKP